MAGSLRLAFCSVFWRKEKTCKTDRGCLCQRPHAPLIHPVINRYIDEKTGGMTRSHCGSSTKRKSESRFLLYTSYIFPNCSHSPRSLCYIVVTFSSIGTFLSFFLLLLFFFFLFPLLSVQSPFGKSCSERCFGLGTLAWAFS